MITIFFWISVSLICYTYLVYPVLLSFFDNTKRKSTRKEKRFTPSVSMVISVYNEERVIAAKLDNCLSLEYPKNKLEVLIGSDGSTDKTNRIITRYKKHRVRLCKLQERTGKAGVLNTIVPQAKGEIVVFSDANTMYKPDAIKKLVRNFREPDLGCVCGELVFKNGKENEVGNLEGFYWRFEQFLKRIEGKNGSLLGANGGIYAIRKELFQPLPPDTIVEDFVLPMKILEKDYKVVYEPEARAYEETTTKIIHEMERRIRIGAGDFQALLLTWRMLNPLRGFPAFAYMSHKVIRWFVPFFLIAAFVLNAALLDNKFYLFIFIMQCVFYGAAIAGRILSRLHVHLKMLGLPYYFVSMNLALFFGFIRFCMNSQEVTWRRTER